MERLQAALAEREAAVQASEVAHEAAQRALVAAIREANAAGLKGQALADTLGMTRANVSYLLKKYG